MMTFKDLCDLLKNEDEVTVLEYLDIETEDIVNRFEDVIEARFEYLRRLYEEDRSEEA